MGQAALRRDLERAFEKQARWGEKLDNAQSQLDVAKPRDDAALVHRYEKDVRYLTHALQSAIRDVAEIREALHKSTSP